MIKNQFEILSCSIKPYPYQNFRLSPNPHKGPTNVSYDQTRLHQAFSAFCNVQTSTQQKSVSPLHEEIIFKLLEGKIFQMSIQVTFIGFI